jgi:tetraacyldisaccharide 4'-kinase
MRARLESLLNDTWYGGRPPGVVLRTLEAAYRRLQAANREGERAARARDLEGAPIIVVGNLTAGGSGKTPLVIHLCRLLSDVGLRPGVVSRGYGRSARGRVLVADGHSARTVGDEPLLVYRRCRVPVMVGPDRIEATRRLFGHGVEIVISDDGLQRLRLPRALEICVVDGKRGFGNGHLLPAGPLREPPTRLASVDYVVCNGVHPGPQVPQDCIEMRLEPADPASLNRQARLPLERLVRQSHETPVNAVAGIGNPDRFFELLDKLGVRFRKYPFPDHHAYRRRDFAGLGDAPILMTEKDAVKCADLGLANAWCLPVDAIMPPTWEDQMKARVRALLPGGRQ